MFSPSYRFLFFLLAGLAVCTVACDEDEMIFEETRLFRPVLNEPLFAENNTIIVNLGNIIAATSYTLEVSQDSFQTVDYVVDTDTSYVVLDETLLGEPLFWNTLYQVRATAHAADPAFDSRPAELGSVRTERFPSILQIPGEGDVIDRAVRVRWTVAGAPVTMIRIFGPDDRQLTSPIAEREVTLEEQQTGQAVFTGLQPETAYQVAIYSDAGGATLRGWEAFLTLPQNIDPSDPNVINLSESEDPDAVINAVAAAVDGNVILLKKGVVYNLPSESLDKSITIISAYGFGEQRPVLFTTGNWNIAEGADIDHIRFIDIELQGEDIGGDYVFNPNRDGYTNINELTFDNCVIHHFRGVMRIRGGVFVRNYTIRNSIVHHIGGYGIMTTDTDGEDKAAVDNVLFENSTFSKVNTFFQTRQNVQNFTIDGCTLHEFTTTGGRFLRFRGEEGVRSNVVNGLSIVNSIFGHGWDEGESGDVSVQFIGQGLEGTNFNIVNTWATTGFEAREGKEMPGFPALRYGGSAADLWVAPYAEEDFDFSFKDNGFAGKFDTGDPRWRAVL
jgi:hypothetical protein